MATDATFHEVSDGLPEPAHLPLLALQFLRQVVVPHRERRHLRYIVRHLTHVLIQIVTGAHTLRHGA
jgi:hypothetical protein